MIYGRPAIAEAGETLALCPYPLWAMVFYVPLSVIPYPLALAFWMTFLELGLPLLVWMGTRLMRWRAPPRALAGMMVCAILFYHGLRAIVTGQFAIVEAILIFGALLAIQRKQDVLAGTLLGFALTKPHLAAFLLLFVGLWSISKRRWRLLASSILSPVLLAGLSFLVSRDWMLMWLRSLVTFTQSMDTRPALIITGGSLGLAGFWVGLGLIVALALYMLVQWFSALGQEDHWFQWTAALTLLITILITVRTTTANMVLLIPALILILKVWLDRKKRAGIMPALALVGSAFAGVWLLFFLTAGQLSESPLLFLPLPMLTLVGLLWSRWWTTRGPGVLVHSETLSWE
jgi:hypothetical protein